MVSLPTLPGNRSFRKNRAKSTCYQQARSSADASTRQPRFKGTSSRLLSRAIDSVERLAALGHGGQLVAGLESGAVFRRQLLGASNEGLEPHAVNERNRAARIG